MKVGELPEIYINHKTFLDDVMQELYFILSKGGTARRKTIHAYLNPSVRETRIAYQVSFGCMNIFHVEDSKGDFMLKSSFGLNVLTINSS